MALDCGDPHLYSVVSPRNSPQNLYLTPGHPYTTGLFVLACAAIVITTTATFPSHSAIGLIILLAGFGILVLEPRQAEKMFAAESRLRSYETPPFRLHAVVIRAVPALIATSGVGSFPSDGLPVTLEQLEINGDSTYGYAPLQRAIAKKCGVDPDCVVAAEGTSMANRLAMATLIDRGDEVLIDSQPMSRSLRRSPLSRDRKAFCPHGVERICARSSPGPARYHLQNKTDRSHQPAQSSSVLASETALREIGGLARSVGARGASMKSIPDAVYINTPKPRCHLVPESS